VCDGSVPQLLIQHTTAGYLSVEIYKLRIFEKVARENMWTFGRGNNWNAHKIL